MRFLALALGALMLTACVTMHDPREMRARQALSDHWHCKDYGFGFEQGTELNFADLGRIAGDADQAIDEPVGIFCALPVIR